MCGLAVSGLACGSAAHADANSEALRAITDTADKICGVVAAAGESQSTKVSGDVKAQLSGLAKRLADLGLTGTGSLEADSYAGVLRSDLPTALDSQRECKLKVFDSLQKRLLTDTRPATESASRPSATSSSTNNTFSGVNNGNLIQGGAGLRVALLNPISRSQEALARARLQRLQDGNITKLAIRSARIEDWAGVESPALTLGIVNETDRTATNVKISVPQLPATKIIHSPFTRSDIALEGRAEIKWPVVSVKALSGLYNRSNVSVLSAGSDADLKETLSNYAKDRIDVNARGLLIQVEYKDIFGHHHKDYIPVIIYTRLN